MEAMICRVRNESRKQWIVFDKTRTVRGMPEEPMKTVLARWEAQFGQKVTLLTRYRGVLRPSEAAMTIAAFQRES